MLFRSDEYVLKQFGRQSNTYTKSMIKKMRQNIKELRPTGGDPVNIQSILDTFKAGLNSTAANIMKTLIKTTNDRYVTVNIKDKYIEVRSAGGDYLDNLDKIKLALLRYVRAMGIAADPEAEKQEYAKKLYKFLSPMVQGDNDIIRYFTEYSAGNIAVSDLKNILRDTQAKRLAKKNPPVSPEKDPRSFNDPSLKIGRAHV